tara:strand:- start:109 stop:852 length:744 start_codon:yes stop_codon:yes gene_type:complete
MSDIQVIKQPHPNAQPPVERKEIQVDPSLSRSNPSDRYKNLVEEYKTMHSSANGMFNGRSLVKFTDIIHSFIEKNKCKTLLDYGCGKGHLYTDKYDTVTDQLDKPVNEIWGLESFRLFDPGYPEHSELPKGKYNAVVSTDVLEHVPETDLIWVLDEILNYSDKMVFLNIACFKALKTLADGSNAHVSVFNHLDWLELIAARFNHFKHLVVYIFFDMFTEEGQMGLKGFKISHEDNTIRVIQLQQMEG